jgi:glyoxylase-like metal-dependent hydrolase (beta-lactamase superfamily II)
MDWRPMRSEMANPSVERFESGGGAAIYRLPLEVFPSFWGFAHLVGANGHWTLIDCGSGFGASNEHLDAGLRVVADRYGEAVSWQALDRVFITHGHIDHFGGLPHVRSLSPAPIGIHELDLGVLIKYEERLALVAHRLSEFMIEAGLQETERKRLMALYLLNKQLFASVEVDFTYEANGLNLEPFEFIHVPGHCPGEVAIRLHDVLFAGDHILDHITPHQAPEYLSAYTGLGHYLQSLHRLQPLAGSIRLTLGGHGAPILDLGKRIEQIEHLHRGRLEQVLSQLERPATIWEVAKQLFPQAAGYHELLALEEAGAHVEYLSQRGRLAIDNLEDLESGPHPILRYVRIESPIHTSGRLLP